MHNPSYSVISGNLIQNNYGKWGLWLDGGAGQETRVHGNLIIGHEVGFDLEIGSAYIDKMIFDNNILINNQTAIGSREAGGITAMHNLIAGSVDYGIHNTVTETRTGSWSSDNHHYFNNILLDNKVHIDVYPPDFYRSADRQFDFNIYEAEDSEKKFEIYGLSPGSFNFSSWQNAWKSYNNGQNCDLYSLITENITYQIDSISLGMTINIGFDINDRKTKQHSNLDIDYSGNTIPTDGTAIPGPFQNMKEGENKLILWNGLRPLAKYELPYNSTTTTVNKPIHTDHEIKVFPNPTSGQLYLKINSRSPMNRIQISLFDLNGKLAYRQSLKNLMSTEFDSMINLSGIKSGIYLLKLVNENFNDQVKIVIV